MIFLFCIWRKVQSPFIIILNFQYQQKKNYSSWGHFKIYLFYETLHSKLQYFVHQKQILLKIWREFHVVYFNNIPLPSIIPSIVYPTKFLRHFWEIESKPEFMMVSCPDSILFYKTTWLQVQTTSLHQTELNH